MIRLLTDNCAGFVHPSEIENMRPQLQAAWNQLRKRSGPGEDYLGWLDWPTRYDRDELDRIRKAAVRIRRQSDVLVVIGIGGSYLGARAAIEMLSHTFAGLQKKKNRSHPLVVFAGHNLSATYLTDLFDVLADLDVSVNVISKSGTTTEPAIAFRLFKRWMEEKYGLEEACTRITVTTDRARGVLKQLAEDMGYETFVVPDDIGGRYSVLTAVGLLPIAAAGIDVREMIKGARDGRKAWTGANPADNPALAYAAWRNCLLRQGYCVEVLANYEPQLHFFTEWWKQLFGESEGKDGRGLFPAGVDNTTDLHSMGQYLQDGRRMLLETVLQVERARCSLLVPEDAADRDGLNFLASLDLNEVNRRAMQGTILAHVDGGVPNLLVSIPELSAYYFGQLVYFFELACAVSGYLLSVNPFDQPGVEDYKKNMFALLGKPGFAARRADLEARLADGKD